MPIWLYTSHQKIKYKEIRKFCLKFQTTVLVMWWPFLNSPLGKSPSRHATQTSDRVSKACSTSTNTLIPGSSTSADRGSWRLFFNFLLECAFHTHSHNSSAIWRGIAQGEEEASLGKGYVEDVGTKARSQRDEADQCSGGVFRVDAKYGEGQGWGAKMG